MTHNAESEARKAFEAWMASSNYPEIADIALERLPDGNYRSQITFAAWQGWQGGMQSYLSSLPGDEVVGEPMRALVQHLRDDADFNRSWTDGRRGDLELKSEEYIARRKEIAEERELWAAEVEHLIVRDTANRARIAELERVLLYWRDECSGNEPSISVFGRMVAAALNTGGGE